MAPSPPPALMDDLIVDILVLFPPDDAACLARASLVCKAWRRLLSDRTFCHRYREIHGAPPFLGFLYNNFSVGAGASGPLFLTTTQPSPFRLNPTAAASSSSSGTAGRPTYCRTLDCRHGRVLLHHPAYHGFTVWDPITGKQRCFSGPMDINRYGDIQFTAAVRCAAHGCDHLPCSSSSSSSSSATQFHVIVVAKTRPEPECSRWRPDNPVTTARASLYSSETGEWTVSATAVDLRSAFSIGTAPSLLAGGGDAIFFMLGSGKGIFKYDLTRGVLSVIHLPPHHPANTILCTADAEDGGLGVAAVEGGNLRLLSGRNDPDGVWRWTQGRVIELDSIIPMDLRDTLTKKFYVVGFAEGTSYIFVRENDSIFSVDLKSNKISKIGSGKFGPIFPFLGFYDLPDLASARLEVTMRME